MQSANFSSEEHRIKESEYILDFWQWFFKINVTEKVIWRWRYFVIYQNICQMKKKKQIGQDSTPEYLTTFID